MRSLKASLILVALAFAFAGCHIEVTDGSDREITCQNFDDFLYECTSTCSPTWDCELAYDDMLVSDQIALDDCSDCLVDNLNAGVCADCTAPGIGSCHTFMEDLLGVSCW